jgi:C4-dicarboxylate-specific signal transduction histidine kinase
MLTSSQEKERQRGIAGIVLVLTFSLSIAFLLIHVERQKQGLAIKVAERTADLSSANAALVKEKNQQQSLIEKLEQAQTQLLQSEKMAAVGQLAAGVAHEINNPIGFVNSNLGTLSTYIDSLLKIMAAYEAEEQALPEERRNALETLRNGEDLTYLLEDLGKLIQESKDGLQRVKRIVADLKNFSHVDAC